MRKTTALLSASTLGVVAAVGAAMPASADAVVTGPLCDTIEDQIDMLGTSGPDVDADWYMPCVPQFGFGKAQITLEAPDAGFPAGFDLLTADAVSSPDIDGLEEYFAAVGSPFDPESGFHWITPLDVDTTTPEQLDVVAGVFAPVASVGRLDTAPPAVFEACELDEVTPYVTFVSTYEPITTTFSYELDGVTYSAPVALTPDPTYYVFAGDLESEGDGMICVTDSYQTVATSTVDSFDSTVLLGLFSVPPYVWFESIEDIDEDAPETFQNLPEVGTFAFAAVEPEEEPDPELAATGATDAAPLAAGAGALAVLGALLIGFTRRRAARVQP